MEKWIQEVNNDIEKEEEMQLKWKMNMEWLKKEGGYDEVSLTSETSQKKRIENIEKKWKTKNLIKIFRENNVYKIKHIQERLNDLSKWSHYGKELKILSWFIKYHKLKKEIEKIRSKAIHRNAMIMIELLQKHQQKKDYLYQMMKKLANGAIYPFDFVPVSKIYLENIELVNVCNTVVYVEHYKFLVHRVLLRIELSMLDETISRKKNFTMA
ncbi:hypothetical protein RFI_09998 [Reticulomyxa filosa]|uniref:Uncharacterized protein n=1 Tax=Reticulomyxa filosa TaxID=46433 RepID=X6NLH2_RETFI|nr:hypothetical protein RFI_09998 [Reticulomyxa filosa]|eukprot:ETO27135.1 hypothetical protein RFI_09998 [Reticulomyxa filosa]